MGPICILRAVLHFVVNLSRHRFRIASLPIRSAGFGVIAVLLVPAFNPVHAHEAPPGSYFRYRPSLLLFKSRGELVNDWIQNQLPKCDYVGRIGRGGIDDCVTGVVTAVNCDDYPGSDEIRCKVTAHARNACGSSVFYYDETVDKCAIRYEHYVPAAAEPDRNRGCPGEPKGNPCNPANGNKYQREEDIAGGDGVLSLVRYFNSLLPVRPSVIDTALGRHWQHNWDRRIERSCQRPSQIEYCQAHVWRGDGLVNTFNYRPDGTPWIGNPDVREQLIANGNGWTYQRSDGGVETYDSAGRLVYDQDVNGRTTTLSYGGDGLLAAVTGPYGHSITFGYSGSYLSWVRDPNGNTIQYAYDGSGNLASVTYPDGSSKIYHYEDGTRPKLLTGISLRETDGTVTRYGTYAYNTEGRVASTAHAQTTNSVPQQRMLFTYQDSGFGMNTSVTNAAGTLERMFFQHYYGASFLKQKTNYTDGGMYINTYDATFNLTKTVNEVGQTVSYEYNATRQRTKKVESPGNAWARTTSYQYLSPDVDLPTVIESPSVYPGALKRTEITYDANRNPTVITQRGYTPAGQAVSRSVTLGYNSRGQVTRIDGPRADVNDVTTLEYNECAGGAACGRLRWMVNAAGQATSFDSYDGAGRVLQTTDANGVRTNYAYDARGRVTDVVVTAPGAAARTTRYAYNAAGKLARAELPTGAVLAYTYDAAQDLRSIADNVGNRIDYTYDARGNRASEKTSDPTGSLARSVETAYNVRNLPNRINAAGSVTQRVYSASGNLNYEITPNGAYSPYLTYDSLNRVIQMVQSNSVTGYEYDVNDRLKTVRAPNAPNGPNTQYQYDDLGNLLTEISPDRGTLTYTYDAAGNVLTQTDARRVTSAYSYDALNRVTSVRYGNGATLVGSPEDMTYAYDSGESCGAGLGRLCRVSDESGSSEYIYDAFGNVAEQRRIELGYLYTTRYTYDAGNRVVSMTYPDGRIVNTARDALGRVTAVDVTLNNQQIYLSTSRSHRADGLLKAQTLSNGLAEARTYDLQGRLTQWQVGSETRSLSYDLNGNLTQWQAPTVTGNYTYDFLDRLTVDKRTLGGTLNTLTLAYNPNGNRVYSIDNGVVNYYTTPGYPNANNRVTLVGTTTIAYDAAGNTTAHGSYTYAYNLRGLLTNIYAAGTQRAGYRYNHQHQRTQKLADTTTVYHYDLAGNLILETTDASQPKVAYVYADSTPLAQVSRTATETLYYLHTDHEGTPRVATDSNQAVVWRWEGKAFGDTAPTGTATINLRYAGQYYDAESGLFYNWRRYYDPKLGRYLTSDPLGLFAGPNTYAYVSNNPLRWTDPTGLAYFCMYSQSSGKFDCFDKTTDKHTIGATCYSGSGASRDKPADQCVKDKGPIPGGWWNIGSGYNHPELGNPTFNLDPQTGTDTCLRDLFRIHADNSLGNFSASGGCIVCSKQVRDQLKNGGGGDLWVTK